MEVIPINENNPAHRLREALRLLIRNLGIMEKSEASCCGITLSQCHAIVELGRAGDLSLNDLAEKLGLDKSTVSRSVDNLVATGYILREPNPEDRRLVSLGLTDAGRQAYRQLEARMEAYFASVLADIPHDKADTVLTSLELLLTALRDKKCCYDSDFTNGGDEQYGKDK